MTEYLRDISLNFSDWELFKTADPSTIEGVPVPGLRKRCYQRQINGELVSACISDFDGRSTHVAWGIKAEPHCSYYAPFNDDGSMAEPRAGCPTLTLVMRDGTPVGFMLDHKERWEH